MAEISSAVQEFWEAVQVSEELTTKFGDAENEDELMALAKEVGVEVSKDEIREAAKLLFESVAKNQPDSELTDDQLEAVAGGAAFGGMVVASFGLAAMRISVSHSRRNNPGGISRGSW